MAHIVVYEEDDLMRSLLEEWLREAGHRVSAPASREGACGPAADIVILSIYMPKHGGAHMVREVRAAHPGAAVIAISGQFRSGLSTVGATAQTLGVQQVIAKPLSRADLLEAVRAIICPPTKPSC
jgi:DNA-binding response OmpR family regulator